MLTSSRVIGESTVDSLLSDVQSAAERAVSISRSRAGRPLDYSLSSFSLVEEMLTEAHEYLAELEPSQIEGLITSVGSYLLESARRAVGGTYSWLEKQKEPVLIVGEPAFHVALATWSKVRGRLMGDPSDNIPFHMDGFVARTKQARAGDRVLFI
jgi:hypothetical protein